MRIIYNNIIPFKPYVAINMFGLLFVRSEYRNKIKDRTINHEEIHTALIKELWYVPFYIIYFFEWLVRLLINHKNAYCNISFEQEAYNNEMYADYLKNRKRFAQWKKQ